MLNNLDSGKKKIAPVSGGCLEARQAADASSAAAVPRPRRVPPVQDSGEADVEPLQCVSGSYLGSKTPTLCPLPVCVISPGRHYLLCFTD